MEYSDSHSDEPKVSKYNSALAQLYRLDDLWKDSHRHSRDINYARWNEDLDRIWLELAADSTVDEKKVIENFNEKIRDVAIYTLNQLLKTSNPYLYGKLITLQKYLLTEKEEFLRKLQNRQGKGSAYEDSVEDYMD